MIIILELNVMRTVHHRQVTSHDESHITHETVEPFTIHVACDDGAMGVKMATSAVEQQYAYDKAFFIKTIGKVGKIDMIVRNPIYRLNT